MPPTLSLALRFTRADGGVVMEKHVAVDAQGGPKAVYKDLNIGASGLRIRPAAPKQVSLPCTPRMDVVVHDRISRSEVSKQLGFVEHQALFGAVKNMTLDFKIAVIPVGEVKVGVSYPPE